MIGHNMNQGDQFNQFIQSNPAVYHSFDGNNSKIKIREIQQAQQKFFRCLNNLIRYQNQKKKSSIIILPSNQSQLYIIFKDDKVLTNMRTVKVYESNESTFPPQINYYPIYPQYSPYNSYMMPHISTDQLTFPRFNPMLQSQDRYNQIQKQEQNIDLKNELHVRSEMLNLRQMEESGSEPAANEQQMSDNSFKIKKKKKGLKVNDTKNITKNFSKAIITFITQSKEIGIKLLESEKYDDFLTFLKEQKNKMTNIKHLRDLWVDNPERKDFNRAFRVFSQYFLKSQAVAYIYNSRIANTGWHLKYRQNLLRALREPENFKYIKDM